MPSFADSIFLFVLALLLFGPKKLPVLARELGKWMGEFRRASNEFKMQMEEELRVSEQAERQKQIAAMESAAPIPPPLNEPAEPEHPHLPRTVPEPASATALESAAAPLSTPSEPPAIVASSEPPPSHAPEAASPLLVDATDATEGLRPIPIATSGNLRMMPPSTGLPTPRPRNGNALSGLLDSIPETTSESSITPYPDPETAAHGD